MKTIKPTPSSTVTDLNPSLPLGKRLCTPPGLLGASTLGEHALVVALLVHVVVVLARSQGQRHLDELFVHRAARRAAGADFDARAAVDGLAAVEDEVHLVGVVGGIAR